MGCSARQLEAFAAAAAPADVPALRCRPHTGTHHTLRAASLPSAFALPFPAASASLARSSRPQPTIQDVQAIDQAIMVPTKLTQDEEGQLNSIVTQMGPPPRVNNALVTIGRQNAMQVAYACLKAAVGLKQAVEDNTIQAKEVMEHYRETGRCLLQVSKFMASLNLAFSGTLGKDFLREAEEAAQSCQEFDDEIPSITPAESGVYMGRCIQKVGRAVNTAVPAWSPQFESSAHGVLPLLPPLVASRCTHSGPSPLRRRKRTADEFLLLKSS